MGDTEGTERARASESEHRVQINLEEIWKSTKKIGIGEKEEGKGVRNSVGREIAF